MSLRGRKKVKSPQTPPQESKASISQACGTYFYIAYPQYPHTAAKWWKVKTSCNFQASWLEMNLTALQIQLKKSGWSQVPLSLYFILGLI